MKKPPSLKQQTEAVHEMPSNVKNMAGQRFGKLAVVKYNGLNKFHVSVWETICDCGKSRRAQSKI